MGNIFASNTFVKEGQFKNTTIDLTKALKNGAQVTNEDLKVKFYYGGVEVKPIIKTTVNQDCAVPDTESYVLFCPYSLRAQIKTDVDKIEVSMPWSLWEKHINKDAKIADPVAIKEEVKPKDTDKVDTDKTDDTAAQPESEPSQPESVVEPEPEPVAPFVLEASCNRRNQNMMTTAKNALNDKFEPRGFYINNINDLKLIDGKCYAYYDYSHHGGNQGSDSRLIDYKTETSADIVEVSKCGSHFKCGVHNTCNMDGTRPKVAGRSVFGGKILDLKYKDSNCYAKYEANGYMNADQIKYFNTRDFGKDKVVRQYNIQEACKVFPGECGKRV